MIISLLIATAALYSNSLPACETYTEPVCVAYGVEDGTMSGRSQMIVGDRAYIIDGFTRSGLAPAQYGE